MAERGRQGGDRSTVGRNRGHRSARLPVGGRSVRCAIYTRKSTEEGLDQAFNSLDAQREACAAYIRSQQHEGWKELPKRYDDGGFSGGSMDRPALAALLDDIRAGRIDTVVVYKVDRLTRSLADFAKIVELFEAHGVSFVSVTQQFNTTTSMGRLTLNVLLSFAQFEREVTAERIRDKIAASKKKGMWMGGSVPIGYRAEDRQLVVDDEQAELVRRMFQLYLDLGTVPKLQKYLRDHGILTPRRTSQAGRMHGGRPFSRGNLHMILRNPVYIGRVRHRQQVFGGRHEAIVDPRTWNAVQSRLEAATRRSAPNSGSTPLHLLAGIVFDEAGEPLYATQAMKQRRRYGYYTSKALVTGSADDRDGWRIAAATFDRQIAECIVALLRDPLRVMELFGQADRSSGNVAKRIDASAGLASELERADQAGRQRMVERLVRRVVLRAETIELELLRAPLSGDGEVGDGSTSAGTVTVVLPVRIARRGVEMRLVLDAGERERPSEPDPALVRLVTNAHLWNRMLATGEAASLGDVATIIGIDRSEIGRVLQLVYLAPDIVEAILDGRQPAELTAHRLKRMAGLPLDWAAQRRELGFSA